MFTFSPIFLVIRFDAFSSSAFFKYIKHMLVSDYYNICILCGSDSIAYCFYWLLLMMDFFFLYIWWFLTKSSNSFKLSLQKFWNLNCVFFHRGLPLLLPSSCGHCQARGSLCLMSLCALYLAFHFNNTVGMNSALKAERQAHKIGILSGACFLFLFTPCWNKAETGNSPSVRQIMF